MMAATSLMREAFATEDPPNFMTTVICSKVKTNDLPRLAQHIYGKLLYDQQKQGQCVKKQRRNV